MFVPIPSLALLRVESRDQFRHGSRRLVEASGPDVRLSGAENGRQSFRKLTNVDLHEGFGPVGIVRHCERRYTQFMNAMLAIFVLGAMPAIGPLACEKAAVDRGEVRSGPTLDQSFVVVNRGPSTVEITAVQPGCGCLKPTTSRTSIPPGESATVGISLNTLTQPAGPNAWKATVRYRIVPAAPAPPSIDPDGELELSIRANLVREIEVAPPSLAISTASEATQIVTVTDRRAAPLTVLAATTTSPHLTATLLPATRANGILSHSVELKVRASYPPGTAEESLVLTTNDPACRELRIVVKVAKRSEAAVVFVPESPLIRFGANRTEASTLVQLRRPDGAKLAVAKVESSDPALTAKWSSDFGPVATLRAVVDRAKAGKSGNAELKVTFADPTIEVLIVPVSWTIP